MATRCGIGYDSHRLVPGGPLTLGGVRIPVGLSLSGHSDGDAVAHAIADAVLGAAGAGDIGTIFPDSDPANRGRDSLDMLRVAVARAASQGWRPSHVDVTVIAEEPKLAPHTAAMRTALAAALGVEAGDVSLKGKTNEGVDAVGREEAIAVHATVLVRVAARA